MSYKEFIIELKKLFLSDVAEDRINYEFNKLLLKKIIVITKETSNDIRFYWSFVGIIRIFEVDLLIFPKYYNIKGINSNNSEDEFNDIIQIISCVSQKKIYSNQEDSFVEGGLEVNLTMKIINDYNMNGLYLKNDFTETVNGTGPVQWNKTINNFHPVIIEEKAIYLNVYTNSIEHDVNFCTIIHKSIIGHIVKEKRELLRFLGVQLDQNIYDDILNIGDVSVLIKMLYSELNIQYNTKLINTLELMIDYLELNQDKLVGSTSYYGTRYFHVVWEESCKIVYNDHKKDPLYLKDKISNEKLSLEVKRRYEINKKACGLGELCKKNLLTEEIESITIEKIYTGPIWTNYPKASYKTEGSLIPDIINIELNTIRIYDAKYYNIKELNNTLKAYPGVSDVTKQFLYELTLKNSLVLNNFEVFENKFLVPSLEDNQTYAKIEYPSLFPLETYNLNPITVEKVNAPKVLKKYLLAASLK